MTRRAITEDGSKFTLFYTKESPFSNFYPCTFTESNESGKQLIFRSSEQYFMYQKALAFNDIEMAEKILQEFQPNKVRALGRKVRNFDPNRWNELCFDAMKRALKLKFSQNERIRKQLLSTRGSTLAECSPRDCKWGIGLGYSNAAATQMHLWRGQNKLGKALMDVRDELWAMDEFKDEVTEVEEMLKDETKVKAFLENNSTSIVEGTRKRKRQS